MPQLKTANLMQQRNPQNSMNGQMPIHPNLYGKSTLPGRGMHSIDMGIQTDFRENGVQTDPWTAPLSDQAQGPDHAELRSLLELTFQNGLLPAHQKTMEVIQRIKDQQAFDASIPPPLDPTRKVGPRELAQDETRMQMLVERDLGEWKRKETEMAHIQALRIKQLVGALSEREQATAEVRNEILEHVAVRSEEQAQRLNQRLEGSKILDLKKCAGEFVNKLQTVKNFNQIHTYSDRLITENVRAEPKLQLPQQRMAYLQTQATIHGANPLNAPVLKPGEAPYRFAGVIRLAGTDLKTQRDFDEIQEFLYQDSSLRPDIAEPKRTNRTTKSYAVDLDDIKKIIDKQERWKNANEEFNEKDRKKRNFTLPQHLPPPETAPSWKKGYQRPKISKYEDVDREDEDAIKKLQDIVEQNKDATGAKLTKEQKNQQFKDEQNRKQELLNAKREMPNVYQEVPQITQEGVNQAALFLQNMLRGVASKQKLEFGKNRRIGLVQELRLAHELVQARQSGDNVEQLAKQRLAAIQEALVSGQVLSGSAQVIGSTVDQLAKARLRQQQIFRSEAILQIAMRERTRRENLESQSREKENLQRSRSDYHQKVIQNAHRELVDMIAQRAANRAVDADAEARSMELALREVDALVELDYQRSQTDVQGSLKDFMYSFLIPEVDRKFSLEKFKKEQEKWILAGNLAKEIAQVEENTKSQITDLGLLQNGDQTIPICMDIGDQTNQDEKGQ